MTLQMSTPNTDVDVATRDKGTSGVVRGGQTGQGGPHVPGTTHKRAPNGPQNKKIIEFFFFLFLYILNLVPV